MKKESIENFMPKIETCHFGNDANLIDAAIFFEKNKEYLDTIQEVMVEGTSKNDPSILAGRTRTFKLVHFKGDEDLIGKLVNVHITENNSFALKGEMVN